MKISFREKGMLALTAALLLLTIGVALTRSEDTATYSVRLQTRWVSEVGAPTGGTGVGLVNINTASPEELQALPGIGPVLARAIVEERQANGSFRIPEEILRVSGIGQRKWKEMQNYITVG